MNIDSISGVSADNSFIHKNSQTATHVEQTDLFDTEIEKNSEIVAQNADTTEKVTDTNQATATNVSAEEEESTTTLNDMKGISKIINQNTVAEFGYNEPTNRITIKIKDKETDEVIKEIPSEKALEMLAKAWELAGILVDEKR